MLYNRYSLNLKFLFISTLLIYCQSLRAQNDTDWSKTKLGFDIGIGSMISDVATFSLDNFQPRTISNAHSRFVNLNGSFGISNRMGITVKALIRNEKATRGYEISQDDSLEKVNSLFLGTQTYVTYELNANEKFRLSVLSGASYMFNTHFSFKGSSFRITNGLSASLKLGNSTYLVSNLEYHVGLAITEIDSLQFSIGMARELH